MYERPFPSRRSGASTAVVVTLCEKQNKITASKAGDKLLSSSQETAETGETRDSSQEIIDKSAIPGGGKSKLQWIKSPGLYKVSTAFATTFFPFKNESLPTSPPLRMFPLLIGKGSWRLCRAQCF